MLFRPRVHPRLLDSRAADVLSVAILLGPVLTLPSAARDLQISFSPDAPTWRDEIIVTVSGPGPHCTPQLEEPVISFKAGWRIDIDLVDLCLFGPPSDGPFSISTTLDPMTPRVALVAVHDHGFEDGGFTTADLTVYPGADLEVTAIGPASSAQPLRFEIEGVGACPTAQVSQPAPHVLRADYDGNCPILPPGEQRFTLPLEVGPLAAGDYEIQVFDHTGGAEIAPVARTRAKVWDAAHCVPDDETHCLERGRFRVVAHFADFQGHRGDAKALPTTLDDTGLFWFFSPDNVELTVKVLDGCGVNGWFWVFVSSGSTVEYDLEVTDTNSGQRRGFGNPLGSVPSLIADTAAFTTCAF
jgi:hypothetical protein